MSGDDDIDFDAFMRDQGGVKPLGSGAASGSRAKPRRSAGGDRAAASAARSGAPASRPEPIPAAVARAQAERDEARSALSRANAEHDEARAALTRAEAERDEARAALARAEAERAALTKERAALQRQLSAPAPAPAPAAPSRPTLREVLAERGASEPGEAIDLLLAVLGHTPADLLDGVEGRPVLAEHLLHHVALVCERDECQPREPVAVVHVAPEHCDVCGGSDIQLAWEILLRASRLAGITRLVVVGGSPAYHAQLRDLSRGTDLKLDLVSGRSKPGRRRARNDVERVVIWGATILDHGTSAAYEHLGDRIIRVTHRGISGMLREVARALG